MKKLLILLVGATLALTMVDASAWYRHCYQRGCRTERCEKKPCHEYKSCATPCQVDFVEEEACPAVPCCVRYVKVEEPAEVTKHISYSVACPSGCTQEEKAVGMMQAGQTWNYEGSKVQRSAKYAK